MDRTLYIAEFSKDYPGILPLELAALSSDSTIFSYDFLRDNIVLARGKVDAITESAFLRYLGKIIWQGDDLNHLEMDAIRIPEGTFHVRAWTDDGRESTRAEQIIGKSLHGEGRIQFKNPDFTIRAYFLGRWYVTLQVSLGKRSEMLSRTAPMRPFFSPVSLHPFIARAAVNLSRTRKGETLLDPFCGTGGILLEAALSGRKVIGSDASLQMVSGARMNMKYYGIQDSRIILSSAFDLKLNEEVDAIVTDLPYGRSSPKIDIGNDFISRITEKFASLIRLGGFCVLITNSANAQDQISGEFSLMNKFGIRQHRSLTRFFYVIRKG